MGISCGGYLFLAGLGDIFHLSSLTLIEEVETQSRAVHHVVQKAVPYRKLSHGEAVIVGITEGSGES